MSHPHTHDNGSLNKTSLLDAVASKEGLVVVAEEVLASEHEEAWVDFLAAKSELVQSTCSMIASTVLENLESAAYIVLYEDRSHDAPHGHVEAIYNAAGETLLEGAGDSWHDLDWASDIDEWVWDIYYVSAESFTAIEGKRRFIIDFAAL